MTITGAISQLRTTDLAESIRFYTAVVGLTLEFQYEDFYAGIRAGNQIKDNQGHTIYFGERR